MNEIQYLQRSFPATTLSDTDIEEMLNAPLPPESFLYNYEVEEFSQLYDDSDSE